MNFKSLLVCLVPWLVVPLRAPEKPNILMFSSMTWARSISVATGPASTARRSSTDSRGKAFVSMFRSIGFLPRIAAVAGAMAPKELDGLDFSVTWKGGAAPDRDTLHWHCPHYHRGMPGGSIRKGDWKLIEWFETGAVELYDLGDDPSEKRDLAKAEPATAAALLAGPKAWRKDVGAQMMTPNPDYRPAKRSSR